VRVRPEFTRSACMPKNVNQAVSTSPCTNCSGGRLRYWPNQGLRYSVGPNPTATTASMTSARAKKNQVFGRATAIVRFSLASRTMRHASSSSQAVRHTVRQRARPGSCESSKPFASLRRIFQSRAPSHILGSGSRPGHAP
jgi:hypothetical protein